MMFIALKPLKVRRESVDQILARLRPALSHEPGANLFLNPIQDIRAGGRQSDASNAVHAARRRPERAAHLGAAPGSRAARRAASSPTSTPTSRTSGLQMTLVIDRPTAARMGITPKAIDTALYLAFGQAQVSTIYQDRNQYRVVMEAAPEYWQSPETLDSIYVLSPTRGPGAAVGLLALRADAGTRWR